MTWQKAASLSELLDKKRLLFKHKSKQIVLLELGSEIYAIDNRCPHRGHALMEGPIDSNRSVTCPWHGWKFDLKRGTCLTGGDDVRVYPVQIRNNEVWIDLSLPPLEHIQKNILESFKIAFEHNKLGRMTRDLVKLYYHRLDPLLAVQQAVEWACPRLLMGMSPSLASLSDRLYLYDLNKGHFENQLIYLMKGLKDLSKDCFNQTEKPFDAERNIPQWESLAQNEDFRQRLDDLMARMPSLKEPLLYAYIRYLKSEKFQKTLPEEETLRRKAKENIELISKDFN